MFNFIKNIIKMAKNKKATRTLADVKVKEATVKPVEDKVNKPVVEKTEVKKEELAAPQSKEPVAEVTIPKKEEAKTKPTEKEEVKIDPPKKEEPKPQLKKESTKKETPKKETPKVEVVDAEEITEPTNKENISYFANKVANGERIDGNHQVDFLTLIHKEYISNPDAPKVLKEGYKKFFDSQSAMILLFQREQIKADCKELGFNVPDDALPIVMNVFEESFGVKLRALPKINAKDTQTTIEFKDVPADVEKAVKDDIAAVNNQETATEESPDDKKWAQIRKVLAEISKDSKTLPLSNAIETYKSLFNVEETPDVALFNIIKHYSTEEPTILRVLSSIAFNSAVSNGTPLLPHFMFKKWFNNNDKYNDSIICNIMNTLIKNQIQLRIRENFSAHKSGATDVTKFNYNPGVVAVNCTDEAIAKEIIAKNENIEKPYSLDNNIKVRIKGDKVFAGIKGFTGIDDLDSLSKTIVDVANLYNSNPIKEETI